MEERGPYIRLLQMCAVLVSRSISCLPDLLTVKKNIYHAQQQQQQQKRESGRDGKVSRDMDRTKCKRLDVSVPGG